MTFEARLQRNEPTRASPVTRVTGRMPTLGHATCVAALTAGRFQRELAGLTLTTCQLRAWPTPLRALLCARGAEGRVLASHANRQRQMRDEMDPIGEEQPLPPEASATLLFAGEKRRPPKHKGRPLSPEHRAALSRAHTGRPLSPEHRAAISQGLREKGLSPVQRAAISRALTGKPKTPEHRAAISRGRKGKKLSLEHRAALSRALKGKKHKPHKNKGRPLSREHRAVLSRALKGKKHKPRATINKENPDQYVANPTQVARPV